MILWRLYTLVVQLSSNAKSSLWGVSIALSWTWGLGLFFSVQMALHFGVAGLLGFAIPNAIGLILFGFLTQRIARRQGEAKEFERHFFDTSYSLRYVILFYQITAIALTFFAVFRYLFLPLGVNLMLGVLLILGAALLLGEQFNIRRIKYSHFVMFLVILVSMAGIAFGFFRYLAQNGLAWSFAPGHESVISFNFVGFFVAIVSGLTVGPWLDVQQWHRAIQIHREKTSVRRSYLIGGTLFFCILVFHGLLASSVMAIGGEGLVAASADGMFHAKDVVVRFLFQEGSAAGIIFRVSYVAFLLLCIISTLDSGYVSLKWYLKDLGKRSESIITSIIPPSALWSPVTPVVLAVLAAIAAIPMRFELEYFMAIYASFTVGYSIVLLFRTAFRPEFTNFTQTTLFSVAAFSLGVFGIGYFEGYWFLLVVGTLLPAIHGLAVISGRAVVDDLQRALPKKEDSTDEVPLESVSGKAAQSAVTALENAITRLDPKTGERFKSVIHRVEPTAAQALAMVLNSINPENGEVTIAHPIDPDADMEHAKGRFEGKWYIHSFMTTYSDTNSVGNVYFANYITYVGKVREMFFRSCMPDFDLKKTGFYILTRQIEHKFNIEAKEFDILTVRIRVHSFNRKFATLEHEIMNQARQILGRGKQILMFVSAKDYRLVDMPQEVQMAFLPHI